MKGSHCINPKCGHATEMSSTLYWCGNCNIPIYEKVCPICEKEGSYVATDLRPVFPEENLLISILLADNPFEYQKDSVWYGSNSYIVNGKKVKLSVSKINKKSIDEIKEIKDKYDRYATEIDYQYFNEYKDRFVKANKDRFNFITEEAVTYIQQYMEKYDIDDMMVSFSGGKDSTVTSHLVNQALGTNKVLHVFGDTTLEFPYTLEYKKRFRNNEESQGVRILTAKNREKNFEDLCEVVGPPSRVMRWCCTVFKTGAIQKTISSAFKGQIY
jgi:phosphoadenosine phosphosulfate reductase